MYKNISFDYKYCSKFMDKFIDGKGISYREQGF